MAQCVSAVEASLMVCLQTRRGLSVLEDRPCIVDTNTMPLTGDTHTLPIYGHTKGMSFLQE